MHELYDVKTDIPSFSVITDASIHDSQVMELIPYPTLQPTPLQKIFSDGLTGLWRSSSVCVNAPER